MNQVELPIIESDASLLDAIELMKRESRSGVFVRLDGEPRVIGVDMILHTLRREGNLRIREVKPREITIDLGSSVPAAAAMSSVEARVDVQERMDEARAAYGLVSVAGGRAVILTRHEPFNSVGYATSMWRCRKDPNHVWAAADLWQPGDKCRNDQSDTDLV